MSTVYWAVLIVPIDDQWLCLHLVIWWRGIDTDKLPRVLPLIESGVPKVEEEAA